MRVIRTYIEGSKQSLRRGFVISIDLLAARQVSGTTGVIEGIITVWEARKPSHRMRGLIVGGLRGRKDFSRGQLKIDECGRMWE